MKNLVATFILVVGGVFTSSAHYLWIETAPVGILDQKQEIRVYFGEYTYGVVEKVKGEAFPSVSDFTLWVLDESGKKTALKVTAKDDYYITYYTPKSKGTYTVLLNNDAIDVLDYSQYDFGIFKTHYHSVSKFQVGAITGNTIVQNDNGITLKQVPVSDDKIQLQVLFKNKALAKNEVKVYVSDLWSKTLETDENGFVSFKLPWKTKYIVETTTKEEVPGTYKDEAYEFVWHCVTTCINP